MKNRRYLSLIVSASLFSALGVGIIAPLSASAQPATKKGRAKGAKGGVPRKMMAKIEEQMGKPLTNEQKTRLTAAFKARAEAQKAAMDKFTTEVTAATGLTADQVTALTKRGPRDGAGKMAPA